MDVNNLSSNWKKLRSQLQQTSGSQDSKHTVRVQSSSAQHALKRKRSYQSTNGNSSAAKGVRKIRKRSKTGSSNVRNMEEGAQTQDSAIADPKAFVRKDVDDQGRRTDRINGGLDMSVEVGKYIALDCEMVGIGPAPHLESALARISIVNYNGDYVYDSFVRPREPVTDWRTHVSGIAPKHMVEARTLDQVQRDVAALIKDRIVVGHSIRSDFDALLLSHPRKDIRDTARHAPFRKLAGGGSPKLKILASELLGLEIQTGEHSSIEDARATILLFRRDKDAFEREHAKKWPTRTTIIKDNEKDDNTNAKKKKKKKKR